MLVIPATARLQAAVSLEPRRVRPAGRPAARHGDVLPPPGRRRRARLQPRRDRRHRRARAGRRGRAAAAARPDRAHFRPRRRPRGARQTPSCSRIRRLTSPPSALPLVSRMIGPTSAPIAFALPLADRARPRRGCPRSPWRRCRRARPSRPSRRGPRARRSPPDRRRRRPSGRARRARSRRSRCGPRRGRRAWRAPRARRPPACSARPRSSVTQFATVRGSAPVAPVAASKKSPHSGSNANSRAVSAGRLHSLA